MTNITNEIRGFDSFNYLLKERSIPEKNIELAINDGNLELTNRIMKFTMRDIEGNIVGYQQRDLDDTTCKSKCLPGSKVGYFHGGSINTDHIILVTEGEIDYLTLLDGHVDVVGIQGVHNLDKLIKELLDIGCNFICILCDNDDAGCQAVEKTGLGLQKLDIGSDITVLDCSLAYEDFKDINEHYQAGNYLEMDHIIDSGYEIYYILPERSLNLNHKGVRAEETGKKHSKNNYEKAQDIFEKKNLAFVGKSGFQYSSESGMHRALNSEEIDNIIVDYLLEIEDEVKTHAINEISKLLRVIGQNKDLGEALKSDTDPNLINLQDGIYNLRDNTVRPHEKGDYCLSQLAYSSEDINNQAKPLRLLTFLSEIFQGRTVIPSFIDFIQERMGYGLTANTKFEKGLILYGSGANGKSVLINVIRGLVGEGNNICLPLDQIKDKNYLIHILGKLLLVDSDSHDSVQIDSSLIKKIVSGEEIAGNMKHKDVISFKPHAKVLVGTNILPHIRNFDDAARRRFIFIHLKNSFKDNPNPNLLEEILEEKEQIFARAFQGLIRLMERGEFQIPEELNNEIDSIFRESDYIQDFLESTYIYEHEGHRISYDKLKEAYNQYAMLHGHPRLNTRKLGNLLEKKGFGKYRTANHRGVVGLATRILPDNDTINE